ncbi:MAG: hypothetical protein AAFY19_12525 [Pseudomonadota bacterium]
MSPSITYIPLILIGLVLLVLAVWLIMRLGKSTQVVGDEAKGEDVLSEGAKPAQRNQALIDAAPAVPAAPRVVEDTPPPLATIDPAPAPAAAPTPAPEPAPAPTPAPAPAPATSGEADDLATIKGVGPKLVTLLNELGVTRFEQIAAWSDADVEEIDTKLGRFKGRIARDQWVEQAKLLISDDKSAYAEKFGQNG